MSLLGSESGVSEDDPGATVMWFGKYQGKRLDELDIGYQHKLLEYAAETPAPNLVRFKKLYEKYRAWLDERGEPGATIMWFGLYKGRRLDQLKERYRRELVHHSYQHHSPGNLVAFRDLHEKYISWLDERQSPLSTKVWFGKFKDHEVRVLYDAPRRWRWLINNCWKWREDLLDIHRRYKIWRSKRPPKHYHAPRAPREVVNPMGEKLGLRDDGVASDADESYDSDDGFIVPDDYESTDAEDPEYDTEEPAYETDDPEHDDEGLLESEDEDTGISLEDLLKDIQGDTAVAEREDKQGGPSLSLKHSRHNPNAEDKDDDDLIFQGVSKNRNDPYTPSEDTDGSLPSLRDIFKTPSAPKPTPGRHRLLTRSQAKQRHQTSTIDSSDTDLEAPPAKRNTASLSPQRRRRSHIVISDSDSESDSDTPIISPSKRRRQITRKQPSVDSDSSDDRPLISPHKNRRQK